MFKRLQMKEEPFSWIHPPLLNQVCFLKGFGRSKYLCNLYIFIIAPAAY